MEEPESIQHTAADHAGIAMVNWSLGNVSDDQTDSIPPKVDMIRFCSDMVRHFYQNLGKLPFVEFTGTNLSKLDRVVPVMRFLRESGAKVGVYTNSELPVEFWSSTKDYLNHACIAFQVGQHDPIVLIDSLNAASDRVDIHINIEFQTNDLTKALSVAKQIVNKCKDVTLGLKLQPGGDELTPAQLAQVTGANALVKRAAYKNRTRIHQNYRGTMNVVYPGRHEVMTPSEIIAKNLNHWQDWTCNAGLELLVINSRGDVARGWCRQGGKIGNIRDAIVQFPIKPITCGAETCASPVDVACTKTWY
jgi:hypothetical protein